MFIYTVARHLIKFGCVHLVYEAGGIGCSSSLNIVFMAETPLLLCVGASEFDYQWVQVLQYRNDAVQPLYIDS